MEIASMTGNTRGLVPSICEVLTSGGSQRKGKPFLFWEARDLYFSSGWEALGESLNPHDSKCGWRASGTGIIGNLVKNAEFRVIPQIY